MNKFVLIAVFFTLMISSEVVVTTLAAESLDICINDTTADGESENEVEEKAEDNYKIDVFVISIAEKDPSSFKSLADSQKSIFSKPFLDQATPPPEA